MNKIRMFVILTISISSILVADFRIEKSLIDKLTIQAIENIKPLPENIQDVYKTYIDEYPDGIMAFMINSEKSGTLWDADPEDLLANYHQLIALAELEDFDYSSEFFLSYIAKITVGHEKLTSYRKIFADEGLLTFVQEYPELTERIRAVNLWCRENMMFVSTSGRSQDPVTILQKSVTGRCGEMQGFFISACRTVGIPARPAWTPWWPHTDNNHAWTEVFVDGNWHYVENAQPDYYLDSTWFTGSVNKTLLVLARSSFPDSLDDVVSESSNMSNVNSTRYYQETRNIKFRVFDENIEPVIEAKVNILAFNFSLLRPLLEIKTDSMGVVDITISKGSFLVIASKDSLFDYIHVPFDNISFAEEYTLIIKEKNWKNEDYTFEYPEAIGIRKDDPEFFAEKKELVAEKYNQTIKEIQSQEIPEFAPAADSNFVKLFEDCRNNKNALLEFIQSNVAIPTDFWLRVKAIDEKYYWEADPIQWENLYDTFLELVELNLTDEQWNNLLSPSVFYEILPTVRVPENLKKWSKLPKKESISKIIEKLHSDHEIDKDQAPTGLLSLDKMLEADFLQDFHFKTLSCYVLKANHIPASYTRIPSTVMVMVDSIWQNYDIVENDFVKPQDESEKSLIKVEFQLQDENQLPVTLNSDNISTTIFQDGRFYYNDRQLEYDIENNRLTGELEEGEYQIQCCIRESGEITKVKLVALNLLEQSEIINTLIFKDFKRNWKKADDKYLEFIAAFLPDTTSDCVVLIGDYDNEPVQRLANRTRSKLQRQSFVWIGKNKAPGNISNYIISDEYENFLKTNSELKHRLITFYYDSTENEWLIFEGIWDILYK